MAARRLLLLAMGLGLLAPACTKASTEGESPSPTPPESAAPSESPTPAETATESPTESATPEPVLANGKYIVFIKNIKAGPMTIRFDLAEMLTGDEATEAAIEDGVIEPGDVVPNDYYIRNENPKLRKMPIADDVKVRIVNWDSCCDSIPGELDKLADAFETGATDGLYRSTSPFWIRVKEGVVVKIEEQYLP